MQAAVSEGSVYNYERNVCIAIISLRDHFLCWPTGDRLRTLRQESQALGFPGCIGLIDGSLIPLKEKPLVHGDVYYCRKKFPAVSIYSFEF